LKALEKFPKIKTFVTKNTNVRSEIFENKISAIRDRLQPKFAKSAPDLANKLRTDNKRQTRKLLKSSVFFLNMLQKTQKKTKLNDIPEEGTPKSSKTNQSSNTSGLFNWVSNRSVTPGGAIGKMLKALKRSSDTFEHDSGIKMEKDVIHPKKTISHPNLKHHEDTSSMDLLQNTSITPINNSITLNNDGKQQVKSERKLQIKGSINLDEDESPKKGDTTVGSDSPIKSIFLRNRSLSPMNIFKKKVTPIQSANPENPRKMGINRSSSEDSVALGELPKIQITPTSEGEVKSPFKVGISPFARRGSFVDDIRNKRNFLNEIEKDKIIPEEPNSTTTSKMPKSRENLDDPNMSRNESKIKINDHAYFKKLNEKFNQVYKLREKNETIIQELKNKKEVVNDNITEILSKQADLDIMIKKLFELRKEL